MWRAFCPVKAACAFCAAAVLLARSDTQSIPRSPTPCCNRKNHSKTIYSLTETSSNWDIKYRGVDYMSAYILNKKQGK